MSKSRREGRAEAEAVSTNRDQIKVTKFGTTVIEYYDKAGGETLRTVLEAYDSLKTEDVTVMRSRIVGGRSSGAVLCWGCPLFWRETMSIMCSCTI